MALQPSRSKWTGIFLFALGTGIGLYLSGAMTWAEIESSLAATPGDSKALKLSCPLMLSFQETGTIQTKIVNETDQEVKPYVIASFGQPEWSTQRKIAEIYILAPGESLPLEWQVSAADAAFGRIIPVSVIQSRYNINPPRWGICGILLFSLFGLNGGATISLIISFSLLAMLTGILLVRPFFIAPDSPKNFAQMGLTLTVLTVTALASAAFRTWGLTTLLDILSLILIGILITELIVPQYKAH